MPLLGPGRQGGKTVRFGRRRNSEKERYCPGKPGKSGKKVLFLFLENYFSVGSVKCP